MRTFTMITKQGKSKDNISAYTLISSDYQTVTMSVADLVKEIKSGKIKVNNLSVEGSNIVSTNGALDKYTFINTDTGMVEGVAHAVILNRAENKGKLIGYTVFTNTGSLAELSVAETVALAKNKLISNGKIRHTEDGDIVSAIGGNFVIRDCTVKEAPKGKITTQVLFFGKVVGMPSEYFGAIISCTSAAEMSRLATILHQSNANVIAEAVKFGGQDVRNQLKIQRMGTNSLYGAFELPVLEKLIKAQAKVENKLKSIAVSVIKYDKDFRSTEGKIELGRDWKPKARPEEGPLSGAVTEYAKAVVAKFGSVKVE